MIYKSNVQIFQGSLYLSISQKFGSQVKKTVLAAEIN